MPVPFDGFDLSQFWNNSEYALENYVSDPPDDEMVSAVEAELGYKLPASYILLMKLQNGGAPVNAYFPADHIESETSWVEDYVEITNIIGIGRIKSYSLCGEYGTQFMRDEWGYPDIGISICDTPFGAHEQIMLDYRACGRQGEPQVVHVDEENDYEITILAPNFEAFVRGLVHEDVYDTTEEDLKIALRTIESGAFSELLFSLIDGQADFDFGRAVRNICEKVAIEHQCFAFHQDEISYLMYDVQFLLYTRSRKVPTKSEYLGEYKKIIAMADAEFSTGGYCTTYVEEWFDSRLTQKQIIKVDSVGFKFSQEYEKQVLDSLKLYL